MSRRVLVALLGLALLALLAASSASACPVCFDAEDEARGAYLATTIVLSLLPLGLGGGAALWLRRRLKEREDQPSPQH